MPKMQTAEEHHEQLVKGLYEQMKPILDKSEHPYSSTWTITTKHATISLRPCWVSCHHKNEQTSRGFSKST